MPPKALENVLNGFAVHQGDRGELVALVLLLIVRDNAVRKRFNALDAQNVSSTAVETLSEQARVISVCGFLEELFALPGTAAEAAWEIKGEVLHEDILSAGPSVFKSDEEKDRPLKETFADAKMHFNHFIKINDRSLLRREYLLFLASRGIGALCATSRAGIDGFVPFMFQGSAMKPDNVGVILFQFKNDHRYATTINPSLLDGMDPYDLGFYNEEGDADVPIIRIVLALAGRAACLKARPPPSLESKALDTQAAKGTTPQPGEMKVSNLSIQDTLQTPELSLSDPNSSSVSDSDGDEEKQEPRRERFTAYDFWWSGLTRAVYAPVTKESEGVWAAILCAPQLWKETYETGDEARDQLRKAQNPGAAADLGFFSQWVSGTMHDDNCCH